MILIDMYMPDNCEECKICQWDEMAIEDYCPFTETAVPSTGRQKDCPLIEPVMRWIPVSERLPELKHSVLITNSQGWTAEGEYDGEYDGHHRWVQYRWNATLWDDEVIAWMPLPEPYTQE